jgi:adenylate cyclase
MEFRIGVNLGDVIDEEGTLYGDGVNVAARLEGLADPGGVSISGTAFDQVRDKLNLGYKYLGEVSVKNIPRPIRAYKVLIESEYAGKLIEEEAKPTGNKWILPVLILSAIIVTSIGWYYYQNTMKSEIEPASVDEMAYPLPDNPSIAVLSLDNLSGNPQDEFIADAISESIITALSKTPKMFVISRNSSFTYKGKATKVQKIAEDLGVRYVLEGSLQKSNDQLRINVQLIDALTGNHIWAEKYDRTVTDFFALQDDITMKIITALNVKLTQGEQANIIAKGTKNLEAYLKVLQGLQLAQSFNKERLFLAEKIAKEAISLDPNYPAAYHLLSYSLHRQTLIGATESREKTNQLSIKNSEKAIALDNSYVDAHAFRGWLYAATRQHDKGIAKAEYALSLNPRSVEVYYLLGLIIDMAGKCKEAIKIYEKGLRLSPIATADYHLVMGMAYGNCGRYEEALSALNKSIYLEPDDLWSHFWLAYCYLVLGREAEARAEAAEVMRINPKFSLTLLREIDLRKDRAVMEKIHGLMRKAELFD